MKTTVRFGGAQIPCTPFIRRNVITIKAAIDWAAENNIDYLVTPEASLSGYSVNFNAELDVLASSLAEIEKYAAEKQVGLCLGTLWVENGPPGDELKLVKRNQIRYYAKNGRYLGATNKSVLTPLDNAIGVVKSEILTGIVMPVEGNKIIPVAGLICADLYGHQSNEGGLPEKYLKIGVKLIIHATNADRGVDEEYDEIENIWLEGNIRRVSRLLFPMIVVDNCYMMDGKEYHGKTATQSGACVLGKWVASVPRTGTHYFYYDFPIDEITVSLTPSEQADCKI
jgi:predicted amidohydrolase